MIATQVQDLPLWQRPLREAEVWVGQRSETEVERELQGDPWLANYALSLWEKLAGRTKVRSFPWHQAWAVADYCNAKCGFCGSWRIKEGQLEPVYLERHGKLLSLARTLILTGGEPTAHPRFATLLAAVSRVTDPRCFRSVISNGDRLGRFQEQLAEGGWSVSVSLNAGCDETHRRIMKLPAGAFDRAISAIRFLRSQGRYVAASLAVTAESLADIPRFLDVCADSGVQHAYLKALMPIGVGGDYADNAANRHPDFPRLRRVAAEAIARARLPVAGDPAEWDQSVQSLAVEMPRGYPKVTTSGMPLPFVEPIQDAVGNPFARSPPHGCDFVYFALHLLDTSETLHPCCFMPRVPGFEAIGLHADSDFHERWNSPAMVTLRTRLRDGPLFPACLRCTPQMAY